MVDLSPACVASEGACHVAAVCVRRCGKGGNDSMRPRFTSSWRSTSARRAGERGRGGGLRAVRGQAGALLGLPGHQRLLAQHARRALAGPRAALQPLRPGTEDAAHLCDEQHSLPSCRVCSGGVAACCVADEVII